MEETKVYKEKSADRARIAISFVDLLLSGKEETANGKLRIFQNLYRKNGFHGETLTILQAVGLLDDLIGSQLKVLPREQLEEIRTKLEART